MLLTEARFSPNCQRNCQFNLGWLPWPVLHKASWPKPQHAGKRAMTENEYQSIIKAEQNQERRAYYELFWEVGSAQMDAAQLTAEGIDWNAMTFSVRAKPCARLSPTMVLDASP